MKTKSIGFIGGGRITKIFLQGFKNRNVEFTSIKVCDTNKDTITELKELFHEIETTDALDEVAKQDIVFIAIHPPVIGKTIIQLKSSINNNTLLISLAPKFSIEKLSELTGTKRIVRMIPNAASHINKGYNPVCFSDVIDNSEKNFILDLLKSLGNTFNTLESKLEAYAIVSAMLPTYFWFQWKEMEKIANEIGLSEKESQETIFETLKASLELMYNSNMDYSEVSDLIPVKPIAQNEVDIKNILNSNLISLFYKIKS
ncbi:pyrroline-5-carboxylate reductase family protein [Ancylomarina sp.]|uniref:pyrroline-5-carboxylate reductase family protein n=1 Tax=Ancylomarina sp. TaxID=1970196 RepID=UPI003564B646